MSDALDSFPRARYWLRLRRGNSRAASSAGGGTAVGDDIGLRNDYSGPRISIAIYAPERPYPLSPPGRARAISAIFFVAKETRAGFAAFIASFRASRPRPAFSTSFTRSLLFRSMKTFFLCE